MTAEEFQKPKHAADAIEEAVAWHTVGIVTGSGERKWQGIGTGAAVRWRGGHYILTAEHVLRSILPGLHSKTSGWRSQASCGLRSRQHARISTGTTIPTDIFLPFTMWRISKPTPAGSAAQESGIAKVTRRVSGIRTSNWRALLSAITQGLGCCRSFAGESWGGSLLPGWADCIGGVFSTF